MPEWLTVQQHTNTPLHTLFWVQVPLHRVDSIRLDPEFSAPLLKRVSFAIQAPHHISSDVIGRLHLSPHVIGV